MAGDRYLVKLLIAPTGERLPMLTRGETDMPCELALRWTVLERREHVAASTMQDDLRAVGRAYEWADATLDVDLDAFLKEGHIPTATQIASLARHLKTPASVRNGEQRREPRSVLPASTFNARWDKVRLFLLWAAETYVRDPHGRTGQYREVAAVRAHLDSLLAKHRVSEPAEQFKRALTTEQWEAVQEALDIERDDVWPDLGVRFRNHTMVYLVMNTGLRPGEVLKLKQSDVPRGTQEYLVVKRNPDALDDPRADSPEVKTNERELFVPPFLRQLLARYATEYRPRSRSPYLFLAQGGRPLSKRRMRQVAEELSEATGVPLTPYSFRRTFLDTLMESVKDMPNGRKIFQEIAGHSSEQSARPYTLAQRERAANAFLASYQDGLFPRRPAGANRATAVATRSR